MQKNILIIGASSGIGEETAKLLLESGHNVYSASRNAPNTAVTTHFTFDVSNPDFSVFETLPLELHGIVYCPGTINLKPFNRLNQNDFMNDFQINVMGAIGVIQNNIARLKASGDASVVLYSTVAVQTGMGFHASVAASKGAVEGLTRSLAAEYAASNIRFNAIAPSLTATPLAKNLLSTPEKIEASNKRHPLNRVGTSAEIAAMTSFLLSENGSWMTGQVIKMDGGVGSLKTF
jgi:3-oxoacyl-[acyl-carrier protein] reductase